MRDQIPVDQISADSLLSGMLGAVEAQPETTGEGSMSGCTECAEMRECRDLSDALARSLRADVERLTAENDRLRWQLKHMQRLAVP
jgi:hypothetical protein